MNFLVLFNPFTLSNFHIPVTKHLILNNNNLIFKLNLIKGQTYGQSRFTQTYYGHCEGGQLKFMKCSKTRSEINC